MCWALRARILLVFAVLLVLLLGVPVRTASSPPPPPPSNGYVGWQEKVRVSHSAVVL